jgi:hypothetical protein
VPQAANAISHISPGGQIISGTVVGIGSLSGGYAFYLWIRRVKSPLGFVTEVDKAPPVVEIEKHPFLQVVEVPTSQWKEIEEIAFAWHASASDKISNVAGREVTTPEEQEALESVDAIQNSFSIIGRIYENFSIPLVPGEKRNWNTVLICRDKRQVQAIALIDKQENDIAYVATHPDNIRHKMNENIATRVQGTGTEIILYLAKLALQINKPIRLEATGGAVPFYEKLQFDHCPALGAHLLYPMELTVEKIERLIEQGVPPFDRLTLEKDEKESSDYGTPSGGENDIS